MKTFRQAVRRANVGTALENNDLQAYYIGRRLTIANYIYDMLLLILALVLIKGAL